MEKDSAFFLHMSRSLRFCLPRYYSFGIGYLGVSVGFFQRSLVGYQDYDRSVDLSAHFLFFSHCCTTSITTRMIRFMMESRWPDGRS